MIPDRAWSTCWSSACSFFSSSFWKSSARRAASRRLRSKASCFSRRASAVISGPFFSSSSRRLSSSLRLPSISRCMVPRSRSSCSRAATPAAERASTRWTSMKPTRVAPAAAAGAAGAWAHAAVTEAASAATTRTLRTCAPLIPSPLERRPDREVEGAEVLTLLPVQIHTVVQPQRAERREPAQAGARRLARVGRIELGPEAVRVADVEEAGDADVERQRDDVLDVAQHLGRPAHAHAALVLGREPAVLEAPDRVGAAQVEALEQRQGLVRPPEPVPRLRPGADDVVEPDGPEVARGADRLDEARIAAEPRELRRQARLPTARRREDVVPAVARERSVHRGGHARAGLVPQRVGRRLGEARDLVARHPVAREPTPVLGERVAQPQAAAERVVVVLRVLAPRVEQVEARRQLAVEQPWLGEADHALLAIGARADPDRRLPAAAEEVALRQVDRADEAVHRRVAAADAEEAGRLLGHLDVDDDLRLVGPGLRRQVHG